MMLKLQTWTSNVLIGVNPHQVIYVKEAPNGCVIYFANDKSLHVKNDYLEVLSALENALM